ncbi:MAG: ABC transporter ATP-binding protein [Caldilineaceae bacterium SB0666_bin_21]|nr:ABC transporter ATP-binding protein [Caldilineaceae bacterium SB0666_bin_21]
MTLPDSIARLLGQQLPGYRIAASFRADIGRAERFTDQWIVAGNTGLVLVEDDTVELLPWPEVGAIACHRYVGGGGMTSGTSTDTRLIARFSAARMADAQNFAQVANRIRTGEMPAPSDSRPETPQDTQAATDRSDRDSPPSGNILVRLFQLMPGSKWWRLPIVALTLAGGGIAAVASPYLVGQVLFDEVLFPKDMHTGQLGLGLAISLILLARLAETALRITWGLTNASLIHDLEMRLKRTAFAAIQHLPMRFFSDRHTGELMTRLEQDASDIALLFHIILPSAIHGGVFLAGSLIAMVALDWQLALAVLLPFPILFIVFRRIFPEVDSLYERLFRAEADLRTVTSDSLTGIRVVRAFGRQRREMARFARPNRTAARLGFRADAMIGSILPPMALVTELVLVGVWAAGVWMIAREQVTLGLLITFAGYLGRFFHPVGELVGLIQDWAQVSTAARRLLQLIDSGTSAYQSQGTAPATELQGHIILEQVGFAYEPGQPVLRNMNLTVGPGETVGLAGPTGAGKSTVLNLIAGLYTADEGRVLLDDVDMYNLPPRALAGRVGVVLQETHLFLGNVADNIAYARPDAGREDIVAAAKAANAHDFIVELPDGYETQLGPGGHNLSGGQRQRLAIARALLLDPPILLMDEATANVDSDTEQQIQQAIERVAHGRTVVVIAHRLSTLRTADRLYFMEDGRVVESGTHAELMDCGGSYRRLVERQRAALETIGIGE